MKLFDLSIPTEASPSEPLPVSVEHQAHEESAALMAGFFEATVGDLPDGLGWANDNVTMNAHSGTHVDAPGITTLLVGGLAHEQLMSCHLNGFLAMEWSWICAISPRAV